MRDPGEEDAVLVDAARVGDRQAFALLYHRYKPDVWNLAYLTLRDHDESEDALQETFVRALRALSSSGHITSVRAWLLTICRHVCLDRIRARRHRRFVSIDAEGTLETAVARPADDAWLDLHRAVETLAPEDREAFMLVDILGYRSHEAAAILGLAASSTLRSRLARARRQIATVTEGVARDPSAAIWGVYHRPPESAIVASFPTAPRGGEATGSLADLLAKFERATAAGSRERGIDLVEFLDDLEDHIPARHRVLAVLDGRRASGGARARHWLADHPRWQVREALSHAGWLLDVESLLRAAGTGRRRLALSALEDTRPFLWTYAT